MLLQVDTLLYCISDGSCLVPLGTESYEQIMEVETYDAVIWDVAPRWFLMSRVHGVVHFLVGLRALKEDV
jgi:hypothetical protein